MKIYHGHAADSSLEKAENAAPSHDHRVMLSDFLTDREHVNYAVDNGAFVCWKKGNQWLKSGRAKKFVEQLERAVDKPQQPDFVVLPDVIMNADATYRRTRVWSNIIEYELELETDHYFPCQPPMDVEGIFEHVEKISADGIFIGGDEGFKREMAPKLVDGEYPVHVGRPGDLVWADQVGVDSVDTTSICQSGSWHRLEALEEQRSLQSGWCEM